MEWKVGWSSEKGPWTDRRGDVGKEGERWKAELSENREECIIVAGGNEGGHARGIGNEEDGGPRQVRGARERTVPPSGDGGYGGGFGQVKGTEGLHSRMTEEAAEAGFGGKFGKDEKSESRSRCISRGNCPT